MRKIIPLLLLNLILIFQLHAQIPCKDTLKWSVCGIFDRANEYKEVDGKIYTIEEDSMLLLLFCITNESDEVYPANTIIDCKFSLKHNDNEIFNDSISYPLKRDLFPTDSLGFMIVGFDIPLYLFSLGKYSYKMIIKATSLDGVFCDSIQELSSFTAIFDLVDGTNITAYAEPDVKIYPIPAYSSVEIKSNDVRINKAVLYDVMGRKIRTFIINDFASTLAVADINNGMYYLMFSTEKGIISRKIIIKRP